MLISQFVGLDLTGQETDNNNFAQYQNIPREKIFVSFNNSLLFTGEYLLYKVFTLNDKTKQPSDISKIGYVELINENKESVFSHKIRLEEGKGQGDFFVPTALASGNYKLIGYTRWMRNGSIDLFFQEDITIINPYRSDQDALLPPKTEGLSLMDEEEITDSQTNDDKRFVLETDSSNYDKRSKVILKIKNFRGASGYGNYRLSVRKKYDLKSDAKFTPESFIQTYGNKTSELAVTYDSIRFAPENDGSLLKGQLIATDGTASVADRKVGISIPGKDFQLKVVKTDSSGSFSSAISKDFLQNTAILQVLEAKKESFKIEVEQDAPLDYSGLEFKKFYLNPNMRETIVRRSVHNQIENAYFAVNPDTVSQGFLNDPYGGAYVETVNLDEFTRFKTLEETIVEIVPNVWTKRNENGEDVFKVRSFDETYEESEFDALVFIDGVLMPDQSELLDFETKKVERIHTVREKFSLGGGFYFGMVNIETAEGNYFETINDGDITKIELTRPVPTKAYFIQKYNQDSSLNTMRLPDFREQLFWKPTVDLENKEIEFDFFTSDIPGEYVVSLEGFSIYGRPVSAYETITVK